MCPIFASKLPNNKTKIGIGWRNKAGTLRFDIKVSVGVCGYNMEVGLEMRPIFLRKLLIKLKLVLGEGIRLESRNLLFMSIGVCD